MFVINEKKFLSNWLFIFFIPCPPKTKWTLFFVFFFKILPILKHSEIFFESVIEKPIILKFLFFTSFINSLSLYPIARKGLKPIFFNIPEAIIGASEWVSFFGKINRTSGPKLSKNRGPKYFFSKILHNFCNLEVANDTSTNVISDNDSDSSLTSQEKFLEGIIDENTPVDTEKEQPNDITEEPVKKKCDKCDK